MKKVKNNEKGKNERKAQRADTEKRKAQAAAQTEE
jgi:hypothetical protein